MNLFIRLFSIVALFLSLSVSSVWAAEDKENTIYLDTNYGRVVIKLRPDLAPNHVERVKSLTRRGFYNGLKFHRVIDGFMAQTGDPQGTGMGGSELSDLKEEFNPRPFERGVVGMARSRSPHSANSQFFIMYADAPWLNGQYTAWGEVISGMEFIDQIKKGEPPAKPDVIVKMQVAADAK
ncbi:peptidylprolyl isomerase [Cohaesibacter gelatinilyticus]|uniref:Peptidyl-prolyl cis-trans isomerase n=1 Tax=Cohaesibacter gelatinilyticus TaxID=372072 RepID=A0A285NF34_9HYPH|nr:peptidylprolyl isomerase [Cohaesibacter gelatinilyticus]SNZ07577.1 peptidylprolyl isomerase [Cohaesibacter gelatinilyticus]HAT84651.1 peptidylprolyl isomerase [Hyphomicrobiales bacterium]